MTGKCRGGHQGEEQLDPGEDLEEGHPRPKERGQRNEAATLSPVRAGEGHERGQGQHDRRGNGVGVEDGFDKVAAQREGPIVGAEQEPGQVGEIGGEGEEASHGYRCTA